jgi:hypothetical protein
MYYHIHKLKRTWRLTIFNADDSVNQKCYLSTRGSAVNLAGVLTNWRPNKVKSFIYSHHS